MGRSPASPRTTARLPSAPLSHDDLLRIESAHSSGRYKLANQRAEADGSGKPSSVLSNLNAMTVDLRSGASVPTSLRTLRMVQVTEKYQWLTLVHSMVTIESGKGRGDLATCERSGGCAPRRTPACHHAIGECPGQNNMSTE
jgi:hypothetical protein